MGLRFWILVNFKYLFFFEIVWNYFMGVSFRIGFGSRGFGLNFIWGDLGWLNV